MRSYHKGTDVDFAKENKKGPLNGSTWEKLTSEGQGRWVRNHRVTGTILHRSCRVFQSVWSPSCLGFLLFKDITQKTALEDRDNSLPRAMCRLHIAPKIKESGSLSSGFLLECSPLGAHCHLALFPITPGGTGAQENQVKWWYSGSCYSSEDSPSLSDPGVSWVLPMLQLLQVVSCKDGKKLRPLTKFLKCTGSQMHRFSKCIQSEARGMIQAEREELGNRVQAEINCKRLGGDGEQGNEEQTLSYCGVETMMNKGSGRGSQKAGGASHMKQGDFILCSVSLWSIFQADSTQNPPRISWTPHPTA